MPPGAPCGVVTYYKRLLSKFSEDSEVSVRLVTVEDAPWIGTKIAGLITRLISMISFNNKKVEKWSVDILYRMLILFALKRKNHKDCHLIHAQDIISGYTAKLFYKRKLPLILTCHFNDNPVEEDIIRFGVNDRGYLERIYRRWFREVNKFIFVSEYVFRKTKYLLSASSDVEVIYNGVDFPSSHGEDYSNGILKIINVGFIEARKNQRVLISIAKKLLRENFLNFHITIVGDGPELPILKNEINESGLEKFFSFTGWISNVDEYLKDSSLYIHTAKNDNCPYSVIEAISKQVPVIAFSVGGIPEIINPDFLFKLDDSTSIVNFIKQNLDNLPEIGKQQYRQISKTFSIDYQIGNTKAAYLSSRRGCDTSVPVFT